MQREVVILHIVKSANGGGEVVGGRMGLDGGLKIGDLTILYRTCITWNTLMDLCAEVYITHIVQNICYKSGSDSLASHKKLFLETARLKSWIWDILIHTNDIYKLSCW